VKVLVADEELASRRFIVETLANTGLEINCTGDGPDAWKRLQAEAPPRLLILSSMLPNLDGEEVSEKVRQNGSPHYTYIILLTPGRDKKEVLESLTAGADDHLFKPVNADELLARVNVGRRILMQENRLNTLVKAWRSMLDNLPFGVACLGRNGDVLRTNKAFVDLLARDLRPTIGESLVPFTIRRQADVALLRESIRRGERFDQVEMELIRKDGSPRHVYVWGRPLDHGGEMVFEIITAVE